MALHHALQSATCQLELTEEPISDFLSYLLKEETVNTTLLAQELIPDPRKLLSLLILNKNTSTATELCGLREINVVIKCTSCFNEFLFGKVTCLRNIVG
jgi:hypothetical protein